MSIDNLPEDEKDIINIASKAGYLKVENDNIEVKLNSYNQIEIQPKETPFGMKMKVENNGSVTPTFTFDTKKIKEKKKDINVEQLIDDALEDFWDE